MTTFFVSYTGMDQSWAEWIAWQLEDAGHDAIIQAWDFRPGMNFVLEMDEAMKADHTIAVLSPSYIEAVFTRPEWAGAFAQDTLGRHRKLIPIRVHNVVLEGLLSTIIYIDLVGRGEAEAKMELLSGIAEGRAKPRAAVPFPGVSSSPSFPGGPPVRSRAEGTPPDVALRQARVLLGSDGPRHRPALGVAVVPTTAGRLVQPTTFDGEAFSDRLLQEALFATRILDRQAGAPIQRHAGTIEVHQADASFMVRDSGEIVVTQAATASGNLAMIEEDLVTSLERALAFAQGVLPLLDAGGLVSALAIAARIEGAEYTGWMTRAERQASPNHTTIPGFGRKPGAVDLGRLHSLAELSGSLGEIARELVALLRREVHG